MKMISTQLVLLTLVLGQLALSTSTKQNPTNRKRRASIPGAALRRQSIPGAALNRLSRSSWSSWSSQSSLESAPKVLPGNPDPLCETSAPPGNSSEWCPDGWTRFEDDQGGVCLRLYHEYLSFHAASEKCKSVGGELVSILSQERQNTVQRLHRIVPGNVHLYVWKGSGTSMTYDNIQPELRPTIDNMGSGLPLCFNMKGFSSFEWSPRACSSQLAFVCDSTPGCPEMRFGDHCEKECHCHGGTGCGEDQHCQYGCQAGWMGPKCCARKEKAAVAYYCVNSIEQGRYLLLRVDPKNVAYDVFTAVGADGQPTPWCQGAYQSRETDSTVTVKVPVVDDDVNENHVPTDTMCPGEKADETYTWRIKLQEQSGLVLPYDRNLLLTCDFRQADSFTRDTKFSVRRLLDGSGQLDAEETVKESKANVVLEVIDPYTGDSVQQAPLGSIVALRMTLELEEELMAQGVLPYNCIAATPDGDLTRLLIKPHGCPAETAPFSSISASNGTVTTGPFQLFTFPGYWAITITCSFDLCFAQQRHCDNPCDETSGRVKRESRKPGSHGKVTTDINILPDQKAHEDSATPGEIDHSSAAEMMTPVTWFLLVTLVVVSALVIHLLFVRSAKQPIRSMR